jgi:hypothetical protein
LCLATVTSEPQYKARTFPKSFVRPWQLYFLVLRRKEIGSVSFRCRHAFVVEYLGENKLRSGGPPPYIAVETKRYLYVEYRRGWRELYDLRRDPWELDNVAADPGYASEVRHGLHVLLRHLYAKPA